MIQKNSFEKALYMYIIKIKALYKEYNCEKVFCSYAIIVKTHRVVNVRSSQ